MLSGIVDHSIDAGRIVAHRAALFEPMPTRQNAGEILQKNMRNALFSHVQRATWEWHDEHQAKEISCWHASRCGDSSETLW